MPQQDPLAKYIGLASSFLGYNKKRKAANILITARCSAPQDSSRPPLVYLPGDVLAYVLGFLRESHLFSHACPS